MDYFYTEYTLCYTRRVNYALEPGRRERKRQAVHQNLLETASRLFAEQGVSRTTVDDIAEAADVARQTVFNHFPYKEAFTLELASTSIQHTAHAAYALLEAGTPALDVLERTAERVLNIALEQGERAAVVARELLHPDGERASWAAERVPLSALISAILTQAREEGTVRSDLPLESVANRISSVIISIVAQVMISDAVSLRRDLSVCLDVLCNGITERRS
ncbi:MAG: TetR/AcrR family transcriptional regulator [Chloroflexota bacterium]